MDNDPADRDCFTLKFKLALLPAMVRSLNLMSAVGLASQASDEYRQAFRDLAIQLRLESPFANLDKVDDGAWFDMINALRNATEYSVKTVRGRWSDTHRTLVLVGNMVYELAAAPKDHPVHAEILDMVRSVAPLTARWLPSWTPPAQR
jgi:hypothetical protein